MAEQLVTIPLRNWNEHLAAIDMLIQEYKTLSASLKAARALADVIYGHNQAKIDLLTDFILDGTHDHKFEAGLIKALEIVNGGDTDAIRNTTTPGG